MGWKAPEVVVGRGTAARRRQDGERESQPRELGNALLTLLARALELERAALLVEDAPGQPFRPVAIWGRVHLRSVQPGEEPGDGPWSLSVPIPAGGRTIGLMLLDRAGGSPLPQVERELAERLGEGAARVVEQTRLGPELARSRELLARADRLSTFGTLAAGLAHEIRNPLVSVRTFIQLVPERMHDEEFRTNFRDLALGEIERICGLINDLLAFSRPAPAQREATDLNELVGQISRLLDAEARKHDVVISHRADTALPWVMVDEAQVKQVLMNVILNAIQACGPGGRVEITSHRAAEWCVVAVADSGPGIAPKLVEQIFDPFFTTKDAGSGLGLFIAHQIVTEHGGFIAPTTRPGGGTVFSIHFPAPTGRKNADSGAV